MIVNFLPFNPSFFFLANTYKQPEKNICKEEIFKKTPIFKEGGHFDI